MLTRRCTRTVGPARISAMLDPGTAIRLDRVEDDPTPHAEAGPSNSMSRTRRSPKGERARSAIIDAAAELFSTSGYRGVSVDAIAEAAGLSKAGILHHFPSKEAILFTVVRERVGMDGEEMAELSRTDVGYENLERYVALIERRFSEQGWVRLYTVLLAESLDVAHPINDYMKTRVARLRSVVTRALSAGIDEGIIEPDIDQESIAATLVGAVDGLRIQLLLVPSFDAARAFRSLVEAILAPITLDRGASAKPTASAGDRADESTSAS